VLASALAAALLSVSPGRAQVKPPPDFSFEKAETSPGSVTFSHQKHVATITRCTPCHYRTFKMKRGASSPITLAAKQEGKACGACHDGQKAFAGTVAFAIDECDRCHKP
jgi:c(7)-type cytochrome triheme protein